MSLARTLCCLVMFAAGAGLAPTVLGFEVLAAENPESQLQRAEGELAHAAHTDPSHPNASTDPLSVDPDLALWTLVIFVVLLAVLWKFAWGPITAGLEKREETIAHHIADAKQQNEDAKQLLADYEKRLASAAEQVRAILDEARRDAEHAKQSILAEAKSGAEAEKQRALRDIESATDAALQSLAQRSADLALELAGKIVRHSLNPQDHARLIRETVAQFPHAPGQN